MPRDDHRRRSARYTYLACPRCAETIREPLPYGSGPFPLTHRGSRVREIGPCRLIVNMGPRGGPHQLVALTRETWYEDVLDDEAEVTT